MKTIVYLISALILTAGLSFAQGQSECTEEGNYWASGTCHVVADFDDDQKLIYAEYQKLTAALTTLQHQQQEFNNSVKNQRRNNYDARITNLTTKMNNAANAEAAAVYQAKIDELTAKRDSVDTGDEAVDISNHGQLISILNAQIRDIEDELEAILS